MNTRTETSRKLSQAEIDKQLTDLCNAAESGGETWDTLYKEYAGVKFRLEFPLGELAGNNPDLHGLWFAAKSLGQIREALPIDGSEGFTAQGLEGKCSVEGFGTQLLTVYDTLPVNRRALYRVQIGRSKAAKMRKALKPGQNKQL